MSSKTDYLENNLTDVFWRGQGLTVGTAKLCWCATATTITPPTFYVGLLTATPTDSTAGTEVTGGSYARQPIVTSLANMAGTQSAGSTVASSGTGGTTSNNAVLTYTNMPASTLTSFGIYDAVTAGNLLEFAALTGQPIAIAAAATVTFAAGALTIQEDN
jgi:hypothetical protein